MIRFFLNLIVTIFLTAYSTVISADENDNTLLESIENKINELYEVLPKDLVPVLEANQNLWEKKFNSKCPSEKLTNNCIIKATNRLNVLRDTWLVWKRSGLAHDSWFKPVLRHLNAVESQLSAALLPDQRLALKKESLLWAKETKSQCISREKVQPWEAPLFKSDPRILNSMCVAKKYQDRAVALDKRLDALETSNNSFWKDESCFDWVDDLEPINASTLASDQDGIGTSYGDVHITPSEKELEIHFWLSGFNAHFCEGSLYFTKSQSPEELMIKSSEPASSCKLSIHASHNFLYLNGDLEACSNQIGCGYRVELPPVIPIWKWNVKKGTYCHQR